MTKDAVPFALAVGLRVRPEKALGASAALDFMDLLGGKAPAADQAEENYG